MFPPIRLVDFWWRSMARGRRGRIVGWLISRGKRQLRERLTRSGREIDEGWPRLSRVKQKTAFRQNPRGEPDAPLVEEAREWLDRAEQAREVAGQLTDQGAKQAVLQLAESFDRLARAAANPAVLRRRELVRRR
jgi:hypothetical protein